MEIGTWNGVHAEQMIKTAIEASPTEKITYIGFDLFEEFNQAEEEFCPKKPAKMADVQERFLKLNATIGLIPGDTRKTIRSINLRITADFIFIDGGHSLETIDSDWQALQKFIHHDTVIVFDDYYPNDETKGCKQLVKELFRNPKWEPTFLYPIDSFPNNLKVQMVRVQMSSSSHPYCA